MMDDNSYSTCTFSLFNLIPSNYSGVIVRFLCTLQHQNTQSYLDDNHSSVEYHAGEDFPASILSPWQEESSVAFTRILARMFALMCSVAGSDLP